MKASLKLPQFKISVRDENRSEFVDDIWVIYVGDYPSVVGKENLMPTNIKEARELADLHDMAVISGIFEINIFPMFQLIEDIFEEFKEGLIIGIDNNEISQYFYLPANSEFRVTKLSTFCDHHLWDWHELKEATKEIRHVYPMELQD